MVGKSRCQAAATCLALQALGSHRSQRCSHGAARDCCHAEICHQHSRAGRCARFSWPGDERPFPSISPCSVPMTECGALELPAKILASHICTQGIPKAWPWPARNFHTVADMTRRQTRQTECQISRRQLSKTAQSYSSPCTELLQAGVSSSHEHSNTQETPPRLGMSACRVCMSSKGRKPTCNVVPSPCGEHHLLLAPAKQVWQTGPARFSGGSWGL